MATQEIVRPLGLITQPNKIGVFPAGALSRALGVFMRDPGVITTQPSLTTLANVPWPAGITAGPFVGHVLPAQNPMFSFYFDTSVSPNRWRMNWINNVGSSAVTTDWFLDSAYEALTTTARFSWTFNGNKLIVPFVNVPMEATIDPAVPLPALSPAGLSPVQIVIGNLVANQGAAIATGLQCHAVAVHRRVHFDGSEAVSAPSFAYNVVNSAGADRAIQFSATNCVDMRVGDYIDFYRTRPQAVATATGSEYYKSSTLQVTSIATSYTTVDVTAAASLGEALYTNPGLRGAASANLRPPQCKSVATFKGHTFYFAITEPPAVRFSYAYGVGEASSAASTAVRGSMIGFHDFAGTTTNGSPVITGVSASDIVGIKVGQALATTSNGIFPASVTAVGASTITFSNSATSSGLVGINITTDVIRVDGIDFSYQSLNNTIGGIASQFRNSLSVSLLDRVPIPVAAGFTSFDSIPADSIVLSRPLKLSASSPDYGPIDIRATNGQNYVPPFPEYSAGVDASFTAKTFLNRMRWSEQNQPGSVPASNSASVGSGELYVGVPTRDALWIFASDGLWRLSGTGGVAGNPGYDWRLDPVDSTLSLSGPGCACVLRDTVYAYTNRGLVSIDSSGEIKEISQGRVGNIMPGPPWSELYAGSIAADETNDEIVLKLTETPDVAVSPLDPYVYNVLTDSFTQISSNAFGSFPFPSFVTYCRREQKTYLHYTDRIREAVSAIGSVIATNTVIFQPIYGPDPWEKHRWQRVNLIFYPEVVDTTVIRAEAGFLLLPASTIAVTGQLENFARVSAAVPRNAPAVNNCLTVGYFIQSGGTKNTRFYGVSLDYEPMTQQRVKR